MIQDIFNTLSNFFAGNTVMSLYWGLAVGGSLFFVLNLIFASLGGVDNPAEVAEDGTFDAGDHLDTGYEDFHFLSLRAILAFVSVFGWCGVSLGTSWTLGIRGGVSLRLYRYEFDCSGDLGNDEAAAVREREKR